jgi:hypothetical protein
VSELDRWELKTQPGERRRVTSDDPPMNPPSGWVILGDLGRATSCRNSRIGARWMVLRNRFACIGARLAVLRNRFAWSEHVGVLAAATGVTAGY